MRVKPWASRCARKGNPAIMKHLLVFLPLLMVIPAVAGEPDWVVYQRSSALELSVNRDAIWVEKDGLIHFVNQERFSEYRVEKYYRLKYHIRQLEGYADCRNRQYAFVGSTYYSDTGKHLFSSMFPLPKHAWKWQPVSQDGSVADSMLGRVCTLARTAPHKKPD